jgi:hypothetical protein
MPHTSSFSWQSDIPNRVGRSLIETCLERAIGVLRADADIDSADRDIAVDRDTMDVPGIAVDDGSHLRQDRSRGRPPVGPDLCGRAGRGDEPQFGGGAWAGYEDRQNYD